MSNTASEKYNHSLHAWLGNHAPKNLELSFKLNQEAASEGHKDAILAMGWYYLNGFGVPKDMAKAKEWYRDSARSGETRAMYSLGEIAFIEGDYSTAKTWFDRALAKKHIGSHYMLGKMHYKGLGVSLDRKTAMKFFSCAARKGYAKASRVVRFTTRKKSSQAIQPASLTLGAEIKTVRQF